jgi:hypothetical protein
MSNGNSNEVDELGTPLTIVSFCVPLVGLILWGMNKDKLPNKAGTALKAAIGGIVLGVVLNIVTRVLM